VVDCTLDESGAAVEEKVPTQTLNPISEELLRGRYIAALGTENADGTIHLTAVWYLFEDGHLFVATSSKSRKARNIAARARVSLMVDVRKPAAERGVNGAVAIHYSKKRTITGCVNSGGNGMTVTDEKDKEIYALSGDTTGIKPGDRMRLQGKRVKSSGPHKPLEWEARKVAKDFSVASHRSSRRAGPSYSCCLLTSQF
jgi:hypothetical protein